MAAYSVPLETVASCPYPRLACVGSVVAHALTNTLRDPSRTALPLTVGQPSTNRQALLALGLSFLLGKLGMKRPPCRLIAGIRDKVYKGPG